MALPEEERLNYDERIRKSTIRAKAKNKTRKVDTESSEETEE